MLVTVTRSPQGTLAIMAVSPADWRIFTTLMGAGQITKTLDCALDWEADWATGLTAVVVVAVVNVAADGVGLGASLGREISGAETLFQLGAPRRDQPTRA